MPTHRKPHAPSPGVAQEGPATTPTEEPPGLSQTRREIARLLGELLAERWGARFRGQSRGGSRRDCTSHEPARDERPMLSGEI